MDGMMALSMRMMSDPEIRRRMMADTAMRRMMAEMVQQMPADHRELMEGMMRAKSPAKGAIDKHKGGTMKSDSSAGASGSKKKSLAKGCKPPSNRPSSR